MRLADYAARIEVRHHTTVSPKNPKGRDHLGEPEVYGRIILKWM
jgi:hypothetical protein